MHDHRIWMVGAGFLTFCRHRRPVRHRRHAVPAAAQPRLLQRAHRHAAGLDPRPDRGQGRRGGARSSKRTRTSTASSSASSSATAISTSSSRRTATKTSNEFERSLTPSFVGDPRRPHQLPEPASSGGPGGRDITLFLGSDNPELLYAHGQQDRRGNAGPAGAARAARGRRPGAAGDHHQAALRPGRRSRRDDRGAVANDPHRDARRHRAEQRQILARRPPGADHGVHLRKTPGATSPRSRTCRCRPRAAARCR